ncbi:MAG: CDP-tyvelose-2-epimerase (CDP-paratose 2-epimerase)-like protein [Labilithrix sp.]|nr:CDP-tyvelose-2-epimerase (CDP-paratose 2-epimerase)-like protein [Labilithrix sp.]
MTVLVTGGAGFIGANVAHRLLQDGEDVRILDDLSRAGVERNVAWLREVHGKSFELVVGDVRDAATVGRAVEDVDHVFHFAAQVAVTTSLTDPHLDFSVNGLGALNVLESVRRSRRRPSILYTSTNKVYGALDDISLESQRTRYAPIDRDVAARGISEQRPLEFHSPYGCSKGTADQYVLDYARSFGVRAAVFRMSCIYGPRQFGTEDQGWVAHFLIRALRGESITIYGDGKQVRDLLFVDDLVDALLRARSRIDSISGRAFNVGGGPSNTLSLLELCERIGRLTRPPRLAFEGWRQADQRYYVSNTNALVSALDWRPTVDVHDGIGRLFEWLAEQPENRSPRATYVQASP